MGLSSPVVLDQQFSVGGAFGAGGTPSAVPADEDGRIASEVAQRWRSAARWYLSWRALGE